MALARVVRTEKFKHKIWNEFYQKWRTTMNRTLVFLYFYFYV